jgi:hypothetical protein
MYTRESFASSGIIAIIYTPADLAHCNPASRPRVLLRGVTHFDSHQHVIYQISLIFRVPAAAQSPDRPPLAAEQPASVADGTSSQEPHLHPVQKMNTPSCRVSCTKGTQCLCCPNASVARTLNSAARTLTQTPSHRRSPPHATSLMESREPHQALCCTPVTVPCHCLSERDTRSPATALMAHPGQSKGGNLVDKAATSACMSEICCSGFRVQNILK